jgi:hypothetical protein
MKSLVKLSLILRYAKGSLTYSNFQIGAADEDLYEMGDAINSLQNQPVKSINKVELYSITA